MWHVCWLAVLLYRSELLWTKRILCVYPEGMNSLCVTEETFWSRNDFFGKWLSLSSLLWLLVFHKAVHKPVPCFRAHSSDGERSVFTQRETAVLPGGTYVCSQTNRYLSALLKSEVSKSLNYLEDVPRHPDFVFFVIHYQLRLLHIYVETARRASSLS